MRTLTASVALSVVVVAQSARAESPALASKRSCADAASVGQTERDQGQLLEARAHFIACAQTSCPAIIRKDCTAWQGELDARIPTIVLAARDRSTGREVAGARFTIDGKPSTIEDGLAIKVNPGIHKIGAEAPGLEPGSGEFVVREGERAHSVVVDVGGKIIVESECFLNPNSPECKPPARATGPGPLPYVFGGVGLLGIGAGTALYFVAKGELADTAQECGRTSASQRPCTAAERSSVKTKATLEIVSFAVGGAALATAVVLFSVHAFSVKAAPVPGGAHAELFGRF